MLASRSLLGHPGIGRVARHPEVHHPARPQFDDEEDEDRAKEQIVRLNEIARPHVVSVVLDEGRPGLSMSGAAGPSGPGAYTSPPCVC